jgi:hypothetical protein
MDTPVRDRFAQAIFFVAIVTSFACKSPTPACLGAARRNAHVRYGLHRGTA